MSSLWRSPGITVSSQVQWGLPVEVDRISGLALNVNKWALLVDIQFRPKALVPHLVVGGLQLVNSVVADSRSQNLSCEGQSEPDAGSHYVKITKEAAALSPSVHHRTPWCASSTVSLTLMTHCMAHKVEVLVKDIRCMGKLKLSNGCWVGSFGSIAVAAQMLLTLGFLPKVSLYFRLHIRFWPNVLRHFWPTFGFSRKWNFRFP